MTFLILKSLHIIAVICWMAAIFYLPRLFVYHAMAEDQISRDRFKVMERKLMRGIMTPSMIATWVFGLWMIINTPVIASGGWLHAKILLVIGLSAYHGWCAVTMKKFARDEIPHGHVFYRWLNELPVLLMVPIVFLVVLKPF